MTVCSFCESMTYSDEENLAECKFCPPGQDTQDKTGQTECFDCKENYHYPNRTDPTNARFVSMFSTCMPCRPGSIAPGTGNSECEDCPKGEWTIAPAGDCQECSAGSFLNKRKTSAPPFMMVCDECALSTFANVSGLEECFECELGYDTQNVTAALGCTECKVNYYRGETNDVCQVCAPGTSTNGETASSECQKCPVGQFTTGPGSDCEGCPAGEYRKVHLKKFKNSHKNT